MICEGQKSRYLRKLASPLSPIPPEVIPPPMPVTASAAANHSVSYPAAVANLAVSYPVAPDGNRACCRRPGCGPHSATSVYAAVGATPVFLAIYQLRESIPHADKSAYCQNNSFQIL